MSQWTIIFFQHSLFYLFLFLGLLSVAKVMSSALDLTISYFLRQSINTNFKHSSTYEDNYLVGLICGWWWLCPTAWLHNGLFYFRREKVAWIQRVGLIVFLETWLFSLSRLYWIILERLGQRSSFCLFYWRLCQTPSAWTSSRCSVFVRILFQPLHTLVVVKVTHLTRVHFLMNTCT